MRSSHLLDVTLVLALLAAVSASPAPAGLRPMSPRQNVVLDGAWQIEQGGWDAVPQQFSHKVAVPGLVDMAQPAFSEVGKKSGQRDAFWYRRAFTIEGPVPATAILKIHKACFGTKVFLNGRLVGEHLPCFTPALLDVKPFMKGDGQENELVIRIGSDRRSLPADMPSGWDFEKYLFLPGIYDSVELILTGAPYLVNTQVVPDPAGQRVRIVTELQSDNTAPVPVQVEIREAKSGVVVGSTQGTARRGDSGAVAICDVTIPIPNCRLWSPEDPFLYEVRLTTPGDAGSARFGMRSFTFDPKRKCAILNGKPYYLRGTNVTLYRFFEDDTRKDLPWRPQWVRDLHRKFKAMHWNSARYCIGFAPEFWYDIADEEGLLIQDEFPIWIGDAKWENADKRHETPKADKIVPEYIEWMRERWNHACVVIWDGQNESITAETGKAISAVRHLDLSGRPWENGYGQPGADTDCVESHPYLFWPNMSGKRVFDLKKLATTSPAPNLLPEQKKRTVPIIINEYDCLWLNRDGTPTTLSKEIFKGYLGANPTADQRRQLRARYLAAQTEFWRGHREVAGVLHFCSLGYSRSGEKPRPEGGATCDDFLDVERLQFEPFFEQYVRDAFAPVGLMLNFWAEEVAAGSQQPVKVYVLNDRDTAWKGEVRVRLLRGEQVQQTLARPCTVEPAGREILEFSVPFPKESGDWTLAAELTDDAGKPVRSLRDFKVK